MEKVTNNQNKQRGKLIQQKTKIQEDTKKVDKSFDEVPNSLDKNSDQQDPEAGKKLQIWFNLEKIGNPFEDARKYFKAAIYNENQEESHRQILEAQEAIDSAINIAEKYFNNKFWKTFLSKKSRLHKTNSIEQKDDGTCSIIYSALELLYGLAGEIYSHLDVTKALQYLKLFQLYTFKPLVDDTTENGNNFKNYRESGLSAYKFRKCSEFLFNDLACKQITVSRPGCMNDPFDSLYNLWSLPENLQKIVTDKKHLEWLHKSFSYYRFSSFCIDDKTLKNILMWSHYADEHKGICIKYKFKNNFISTKDSMNNVFQMTMRKVNYNQESELYEECKECEKYEKSKDSKNCKNFHCCINRRSMPRGILFTHKAPCWEGEDEARLISFNTEKENDHIGIKYTKKDVTIEAVYFGLRCSDENKKTIKKLLSGQNVKFFDMYYDHNNVYDLNSNELSQPK